MNSFINRFRDNLLNRPQPEWVESDWTSLEARLDREQTSRPLPLVWWWVGLPLAALLLGMNAVMYRELQHSGTIITALEARHDTVFQTKIIYITDTIYQTRVLRERVTTYGPGIFRTPTAPVLANTGVSKTLPETGIPLPASQATSPENSGYLLQDQPLTAKSQPEQLDKNKSTQDFLITEPALKNTFDLQELPFRHRYLLQKTETVRPDFFVFPANTRSCKTHKSVTQHIHTLKPESFALNLTGGWAYPLRSSQYQKSGLAAGLEGLIFVTPKWQLWLGAAVFQQRFISNTMNPSIGVPIVAPPDDDLIFQDATAVQQYRQFSVGLKYHLKTDIRWKPWFGAGYGALFLLPYDLVYDFDNDALGISWKHEQEIKPGAVPSQFALFRYGVTHDISKKWDIQLETGLRTMLDEGSFSVPRFSGVQLGLGYHF